MYSIFLSLVLSSVIGKEALRFQYCQEQGFDTSCGMSVASTLLTNYWSLPVSEFDFIQLVLKDKLEEKDYRVSLADMSQGLLMYGIQTKAFKADWAQLKEILGKGFAPLIVHYEKPSKHFVLLLGIDGDSAITADPASGLIRLERGQFERQYSGIVLAAASREHHVDTIALNNAVEETVLKSQRMGDVGINVGWHGRLADSRFNFSAGIVMPTGISEAAALDQGFLVTGSGYWMPTVHIGSSWIIDPVVINLGLGYSCGLPRPIRFGTGWHPGRFNVSLAVTEVLASSVGYTFRLVQQAGLPEITGGYWRPDDFYYALTGGIELWYTRNNVSLRGGIQKNLTAFENPPVLSIALSHQFRSEE